MMAFIWFCLYFLATYCQSAYLLPLHSTDFKQFEDRRYLDDDECGFPPAALFKPEQNTFDICKQTQASNSVLQLCEKIIHHSDIACILIKRGLDLTSFAKDYVNIVGYNVVKFCNSSSTLFGSTESNCRTVCSPTELLPVCKLYVTVEKVIDSAIYAEKDFKVLKEIWKQFDYKYPPTGLLDLNEPLNICEKTEGTTHELCNLLRIWAYYMHHHSEQPTKLHDVSPMKIFADVQTNLTAEWNPCGGFAALITWKNDVWKQLINKSSCEVICNQPLYNMAVCKALYYGVELWKNANPVDNGHTKNDNVGTGNGGHESDPTEKGENEPGPTEKGGNEPGPTEPGPTEKGGNEPGPTEKGGNVPGPTEKGGNEPGPTEKAGNEPGGSKNGATDTETRDEANKGVDKIGLQMDDQSTSNHFVAYFLVAMVLCVAAYIVFHNKQKIIGFIVEGRSGREGRRPQTKEYRKLKTTAEDVMPSLEKSTTASNYVF